MIDGFSKLNCFTQNLRLQNNEIKNNKTFLTSKPTQMGIIFGNKCNLRCKMCGYRGLLTRLGIKENSQLNDEILKDIISYFPYLKSLKLSGGEPLVYKKTRTIVNLAEQFPNLRMEIMTNGNLINNFWLEKFCEVPFKSIAISLDAATEKTYRKIRIRGNFKKVLNSINFMNNLKNGNDPKIQLSFVVMKRNYHEILDFIELAHKYNITQLSYQAISNQRLLFYLKENVTLDKKTCFDLLRCSEEVDDLTNDYNIKCTNRVPGNILRDSPEFFYEYYKINYNDLNDDHLFECNRFWRRLDVTPDFFSTCCFCAPKKYSIIHYNGEPVKINDIWNSEQFIKARELMGAHQYEKVCRISCPIFFKFKTKGVI